MSDYDRITNLPGWADAVAPYSPAFQRALIFVLSHECEWNPDGTVRTEHDPNDPGGTTKYGIDKASHPDLDIPNLTLSTAVKSYYSDEWFRAHGEHLPEDLAICHFDGTVNIGVVHSAKILQAALGVTVDGIVGPATLSNAANDPSPGAAERYIQGREDYYRQLRQFARFGKGWLQRMADLRAYLGGSGTE